MNWKLKTKYQQQKELTETKNPETMITYNFSRYSEKIRIKSEIDDILTDVLRISNERERLAELQQQYEIICKEEKKAA
jgi:hypothetical protein